MSEPGTFTLGAEEGEGRGGERRGGELFLVRSPLTLFRGSKKKPAQSRVRQIQGLPPRDPRPHSHIRESSWRY